MYSKGFLFYYPYLVLPGKRINVRMRYATNKKSYSCVAWCPLDCLFLFAGGKQSTQWPRYWLHLTEMLLKTYKTKITCGRHTFPTDGWEFSFLLCLIFWIRCIFVHCNSCLLIKGCLVKSIHCKIYCIFKMKAKSGRLLKIDISMVPTRLSRLVFDGYWFL